MSRTAMRGKWLLALASAVLLLTPGFPPAFAAAPAAVRSEVILIEKSGGSVHVFDQFQFAKALSTPRTVPLAEGAQSVKVQGAKVIRKSSDTITVTGSARNVTVTYMLPLRQPLFFDRTFLQATAKAVLLSGPGLKPSGPGAAPFVFQGLAKVQDQTMAEFTAQNLPAGQTILWPISVGNPTAGASPIVLLLVALFALFALIAAWLRLGAVRRALKAKRAAAERREGPA